MHVLFNVDNPISIPTKISEEAVKAADCFVDVCLQSAEYLSGKGDTKDAIEEIAKSL